MRIKCFTFYLTMPLILSAIIGCRIPSPNREKPKIADSASVVSDYFIKDDLFKKITTGKKIFKLDSLNTITFNVYARIEGVIKTDTPLLKANQLTGYYEVDVPVSQQYQTILTDGTIIWLNALSKLSFHSNMEIERYVQISGEGCIETKVKQFTIQTKRSTVKLKKGKINIKDYSNEQVFTVSQIFGRSVLETISFSQPINGGECAQIRNSKANNLTLPNPNISTAWTSGFISQFEDCNSFFRILERWYNVPISYRGSESKCQFEGKFSLAYKLSTILNVLKVHKFKTTYPVKGGQLQINVE